MTCLMRDAFLEQSLESRRFYAARRVGPPHRHCNGIWPIHARRISKEDTCWRICTRFDRRLKGPDNTTGEAARVGHIPVWLGLPTREAASPGYWSEKPASVSRTV